MLALCKERVRDESDDVFEHSIRSRIAPLLEGNNDRCRQVAVLCGVVVQLASEVHVDFWCNWICPQRWRPYVVYHFLRSAQPLADVYMALAAVGGSSWNWYEYPDECDF